MPHIGNHVDAIFLPESVNTSTTLKINGGDLNVNNGQFFVDQSTTNVGIGTATPSTLLDIYGDGANTTQISLRQWNTGDDGPDIRFFCSGGTIASPVEPDTGDILGKVNAFVNTGSSYDQFGGFGWTYRTQGFGLSINRGSSFAIETKSLYEDVHSAKIYISEQGSVGINTSSPISVNLQINGTYNSSTSEYGAPTQYFLTTLSSPSAGDNIGRIIFARNGDSATIAAKSTGTADETDLYFYNRTSGGADNVNNVQNTTPTLKLYHDKTAEFASDVNLPDNAKLLLGTDNDFQIYYDGGTAHIDNNQGQIRMRAASSFLFYYEGSGGNEDYAKFLHNGAVELYHNNNKAFETTSTGIDVPLGTITGPATLNIDPAAVGDNTGTVVIKGNLQVDGTTTTINSTTLTVDDKNIVLASGAADSAAANGAGITIDGANESLTWIDSNKSFKFSTRLAIGSATSASSNLRLAKDVGGNGATTYYSFLNNGLVQPDVTGTAYYNFVQVRTDNNNGTGYTIANLEGYSASVGSGTVHADSTITNLIGFNVKNTWTEGTKNYGFRGQISTGTNRWNVYMDGSAPNYFAGNVGIGTNNPTTLLTLAASSNPTLTFFDYTNNAQSQILGSAGGQLVFTTDINNVDANSDFIFRADSFSNEIVRFKDSGEVGIGTDNPGEKLDVRGKIRIEDDNPSPGLLIRDADADGDIAIYQYNSGDLQILNNATSRNIIFQTHNGTSVGERLRITSAGDVGIGTDNPLGKLHLSDTVHPLVIDDNSNSVDQGIVFTTGGSSTFKAAIRLTPSGSDKGLRFHTGGYTNSEERVRITSDGSVGIGTQQPGTKLEIAGTGSPTIRIKDLDGTNQFGQIVSNAGLLIIESRNDNSDGEIVFRGRDNTGTNEYGRFDENGNVGIGTDNPQTKLDVRQTTQFDISNATTSAGILVRGGSTAGQNNYGGAVTLSKINSSRPGGSIAAVQTTSDPDQMGIAFFTHGSTTTNNTVGERLRIDASGNVGIGVENPNSNLHVKGGSDSTDNLLLTLQSNGTASNGSLSTGLRLINSASDTSIHGADIRAIRTGTSTADLTFSLYNGSTPQDERLRITSDGNVGIGTNNPGYKLQVEGDIKLAADGTIWFDNTSQSIEKIKATNSTIDLYADAEVRFFESDASVERVSIDVNNNRIYFNGDDNTYWHRPAADAHEFVNNGSPSLHISASGNVQLKTANAQLEWQAANNGNNPFIRSIGTDQEALEFNTGGSPRVRIGSGGDVGIGTDAPNTKLDVFGAIKSSTIPYGNNQDGTYLIAGSTSWSGATSNWGAYGFQHKIKSNAGGTARITVDTINGEALCVVNDNKIGIGTNNPSSKLTIAGNSATARLELKRTNSAGGGSYGAINFTASDGHSVASIHVAGDADGDDNGGDIIFRTTSAATTNDPYTNSERLRITSAGQIGVGTSAVARGPLHIHQGTTGDTQIHMTNSETGTSSSDGFTIFQGAGNGEDCGFVNREANGRIRFIMQSGTDMGGNPVLEDQMILTHGGFLGIKTTPTRTLDVNGQAYFRSIVGIGTTGNTNYQLTVKNGASTVSGMFMDCNDWSTNASKYGINLDIDSSNRTNLTSNRTHRGISCDIRARVAQNASNTSGTRQSIYGSYTSAYVDDTDNNDGKMYYVWGSWSRGRVDGVNCANLRGAYNLAQAGDNATGQARTVDSAYGAYNLMVNDGNQTTITNAYATYSHVNQDDTGGTMSNAFGVYSRVDRDSGSGGTGYAFRGIFEGTWSNKRGLWITGSSENSVGGSFTAGSKNFRIRHPLSELSETKDLVHVSVEAPAHDLIYRGKSELVNGSTTINLDTKFGMTEGTFVALNRNIQCFTSNESDWSAVRGSVSGNILTIECQDSSSTATVSWMVIGERQDAGVKSLVTTDADGNLILEPDQEPEDIDEGKPEMPD